MGRDLARFRVCARDHARAALRTSLLAATLLLSVTEQSEQSAQAGQAGQAGQGDELDDPKPRAIDPGIGIGPWVDYRARPTTAAAATGRRACSPRFPICIHGLGRENTRPILEAFERGWATLTGALALPAPDVDPDTLAYDVFVGDDGGTFLEARDVHSHVDRARAFSVVDRRVKPGCALDAIAATAVARASLYRAAPSTEEGTARAQATYLAELAVPCALGFSTDAIAEFQGQPDRTFADAHVAPLFASGAALFWRRLDWAYGRTPGGTITAAWALHPTMTPAGADRFVNEPDTFDVLRVTFKNALSTNSTVEDYWLDFAVARAFAGSNDDGLHLPELRTAGDAARVPLDWDIPWPDKPRRLSPRMPVHPLGSSYVQIHAKPGARLRAEIEWEEHALFRWTFVKIDKGGHELGRIPIPAKERAVAAQMTLADIAPNVDRILLVGAEVGDPAYAFDPDDDVWEPHGWLVTVAEE